MNAAETLKVLADKFNSSYYLDDCDEYGYEQGVRIQQKERVFVFKEENNRGIEFFLQFQNQLLDSHDINLEMTGKNKVDKGVNFINQINALSDEDIKERHSTEIDPFAFDEFE